MPVILLLVTVHAEIDFHFLVCSFRLSICPRVICGRHVLLDSELVAVFSHNFGCKSGIVIRYELLQHSISCKYIFEDQCSTPSTVIDSLQGIRIIALEQS